MITTEARFLKFALIKRGLSQKPLITFLIIFKKSLNSTGLFTKNIYSIIEFSNISVNI